MARSNRIPKIRLGASSFGAAIFLAGCVSIPLAPTLSPGSVAALPTEAAAPSQSNPTPSPSPSPSHVPTPGEPDPALTPGATNPAVTQATIGKTICTRGWTATIRPPTSYTNALKVRQIAAYGYADTSPADYEEDHLISLELGGAPRDPLNLWPEPYVVSLPDGTPVGARVKDRLENDLHRQVCNHQITLATAQALIAQDWVSAWRAAGPGRSP